MRRSGLMLFAAAVVGACAPTKAPEPPVFANAPGWGTAHILLLGNYVGKQVRLTHNDDVLVDHRFTFPPPGAEDRLPVFTNGVTWWVVVEIEGCPETPEVRVALEPGKSTPMIFDGCAVRTLGPE